ncbi:uncharacterized protein CMU_041670 [Cryptosporidium muris RN66]|uniref:Uncharacterized protein n=1 Tax=Cryptosporidium muris (strain RN66) TaxID=441375 RepID=B6AA54_CRYMR|nr:uncharacterized protein CMU_041670 [Cryptosporidium muris RN66]EEA05095.1 hypothetical protein, conserved [Cryptosporidium muris RN66]|eukprot:XP_002139444.1 hypothetical protein [Cryptosporidium muris RN66]
MESEYSPGVYGGLGLDQEPSQSNDLAYLDRLESNIMLDDDELSDTAKQLIHQTTGSVLRTLTFSDTGGLKGALERAYTLRQETLRHSKDEIVDAYRRRARLAAIVSRRRITLQHLRARYNVVARLKQGLKVAGRNDGIDSKEPTGSEPNLQRQSTSLAPVRFSSRSLSDAIALQQIANLQIGSTPET